jgi:predicted ATPase
MHAQVETSTLLKVDEELRNFFILQWSEFSSKDETPEELALSVQQNFQIKCNSDQVVEAFSTKLELEDNRLQMKHLNLYQ